jgi:hypothetical protein
MTTQEFLNAFELKYNMIMSNAAPSLDAYEMSYFLSTAQKDLVIEIYNGTFNGSALESSEDVRQYINHLIVDYRNPTSISENGVSSKSQFYSVPEDVWFRIYEGVDFNDPKITCEDKRVNVQVYPITHDEYHIIKRNPFRRQTDRRVLRLDYSGTVVELISDYIIGNYILRYIKKPTPIVLDDLSSDLSIDGISDITECQLNSVLHETILNRAVDLAKFAWQGAANSKV